MPERISIPLPRVNRTIVAMVLSFFLGAAITHWGPHIYHPVKDTGPLSLVYVDVKNWDCGWFPTTSWKSHCQSRKQYWKRANGDIITMEWDGTMPAFGLGARGEPFVVQHLYYTDVNSDIRHFVKATL